MVDKDLINNLNISNKFLFLDGYGIDAHLDDGKLVIRDGNGNKQIFFPKRFPFNNVIVYGTRGSISFEAIRWIVKHNTQISLINWNGKLLTNILPEEAKQTELRFKQYETYKSKKRIDIARKLIEAKIQRTKDVLSWLKERYPDLYDKIKVPNLDKLNTIKDIMGIEGRVAEIYWKEVSKILNRRFEFRNRKIGKTERPMGAVDPINALFNYGYSLLESECRRAINSVGLDTHVGFLHEVNIGKEALVYDLQEPFRWLIDVALINALEKKVFDKKDFIRTENYNIKLRSSGAKKLVKEIENQLNKCTFYLGREYRWSNIILFKTRELAQYLIGKRKSIDFNISSINLERIDNHELRQKILKLSYSEAKKLGIGKGSLHYLKKNAESDKPFKVYNKIKKRLNKSDKQYGRL